MIPPFVLGVIRSAWDYFFVCLLVPVVFVDAFDMHKDKSLDISDHKQYELPCSPFLSFSIHTF